IDTNKEEIAIQEARKLGIPVVAILDSNSNPDGIAYPVPGNDDAARAITLYCDLVSRAVIDGISQSQSASGIDTGASAEPAAEDVLAVAAYSTLSHGPGSDRADSVIQAPAAVLASG